MRNSGILTNLSTAPYNFLLRSLLEIQSYTLLSSRAIANLFTKPLYFRDMVLQMDRIGVGSLTIIVLTGFFTGAVLGIQSESALRRYGAVSITGQLVSLTLIRELGPVLAALMVAGRIGSGIASELGSMVVSEQINAMEIGPKASTRSPPVWGFNLIVSPPPKTRSTRGKTSGSSMLPLLTIVCNGVGMTGGWLIARYKLLISSSQYWSDAINALEFSDVVGTLIKPIVFGFIISMTGCYIGLRTYGGTEGVGRSTTQAVVSSSIMIIAADFFLNNLIIYMAPFMNV